MVDEPLPSWLQALIAPTRRGHTVRLLVVLFLAGLVGLLLPGPAKKLGPHADVFAYLSSSHLTTINAASAQGVSSDAEKISSRLFPGAFVDGPGGQTILNNDLFTSVSAPDEQGKSTYIINPEAVYSDGVPVTCSDFYLSWFAATHEAEFHSRTPLLTQIASLDCAPGERTFTTSLTPGSGARYQSFFAAGSVMPAHSVATRAGFGTADEMVKELTAAPSADTIRSIGEAWNSVFELRPDSIDLLASAGPYMVSAVNTDDPITHGRSVTLVRNPKWWADPALIPEIVVYPCDAPADVLGASGALKVADVTTNLSSMMVAAQTPATTSAQASTTQAAPTETPAPQSSTAVPETTAATLNGVDLTDLLKPQVTASFVSGGEQFSVVKNLSRRVESLIPATSGIMENTDARRALSSCIDRSAVARASESVAGMQIPAYGLRLTPPTSAAATAVADVALEYATQDAGKVGTVLSGKTVRLGYDSSNDRYRAMAEAIISSCATLGVTVEDVATPSMDLSALGSVADVYLGAVDPLVEFPSSNFVDGTIEQRRQAERALWDTIPTIPLSAEPRTLVIGAMVSNLVPSSSSAGAGWNMDRWKVEEDNE